MNGNWNKLVCKGKDLQLVGTLNGGQSFRWSKHLKNNEEHWYGVFQNKLWILKQKDDHLFYQVHEKQKENSVNKKAKSQNYDDMLIKYFNLDLDLESSYKEWSNSDKYFKEASKTFYGIRILNQDVTENIFSFICSSNNNIKRITGMVEKMATFYGDEICTLDGTTFYSFPKVEALAQEGVEQKLKESGFGYRAKYISRSAEFITSQGGSDWLEKLQKLNYTDAKATLMQLTGIGAKVADCICLMSLGHLGAIPVDTHIYQIAQRLYLPKLPKQKTVTPKIYDEIGDHFRKLYGPLAGWAHTVLFCADLKDFKIKSGET